MLISSTTLQDRTRVLLRPFQRFFALETAGGILLLLATVVALVWANSAFSDSYTALFQSIVTVGAGTFVISKPLLLWINDGLMAIFFFVVGLEIKREILVGELSAPSKAALPIAAAIGGMVVPALIYVAFNAGTPAISGWGIPMATDIAFALGVLALLGRRIPSSLRIFLAALAIIDDLGAVLVIAFFYTAEISWSSLGIAAGFLALLILANVFGVRRAVIYAILGLGLWVAFLLSGVHATIAGVLLAFTIPARRAIDTSAFLKEAQLLLDTFAADTTEEQTDPTTDQRDAVQSLEVACERVETPLERMEHNLHGWVAFGIIPLFALANAGVILEGDIMATMGSNLTLGILAGLFVGKQIGVTLFTWIAVRAKIAVLPVGVQWAHIYGTAVLCGIGFTMSLFIAGLAFTDPALLNISKIGILAASLLSGIAGAAILLTVSRRTASKSVTPNP